MILSWFRRSARGGFDVVGILLFGMPTTIFQEWMCRKTGDVSLFSGGCVP